MKSTCYVLHVVRLLVLTVRSSAKPSMYSTHSTAINAACTIVSQLAGPDIYTLLQCDIYRRDTMPLITSTMQYCDHQVSLLVHYARCDCFKSRTLIFIKFGTHVQYMCQISLLTFQNSRSKFKVNSENLPVVIARPWFKIYSQCLAIRHGTRRNFGTKYNFWQKFNRAACWRYAHSEWSLIRDVRKCKVMTTAINNINQYQLGVGNKQASMCGWADKPAVCSMVKLKFHYADFPLTPTTSLRQTRGILLSPNSITPTSPKHPRLGFNKLHRLLDNSVYISTRTSYWRQQDSID